MDGMKELHCVSHKLGFNLRQLVACTAIFAPISIVKTLPEPNYTMFPSVRRVKLSNGEKKGQVLPSGIRLDDNTYPNSGLKRILAKYYGNHFSDWKNWMVCHIWPMTCYDEKYHTALPNLVLLPKAIAGLSDYDTNIMKDLQYRSYELFKWYPTSEKEPAQTKGYPTKWNCLPCSEEGVYNIENNQSVDHISIDEIVDDKNTLPIEFIPDLPAFKKELLKTRKAKFSIYFQDGSISTKEWNAFKISQESSIIGNVRSRQEFRQGSWQQSGIEYVIVEVI